MHVTDTIGCGIGAFDERPVRICRDVALAVRGNSTIIGTNRRTTADLAAFANCAAFRYLDFNDTYVGRFSVHPSDHIAACLAVAEAEGSSAQELITAIVVAYEVNCRLVDACDISTRGWDPTVMSLPAVALAAGKLMKLAPDQLTHAVNIAINDHIPMAQTRVQTLSDWKGLSDAEAGRNAVFAALLARNGLTGPAPIFEGRSGFFQQVTGPASIDVDELRPAWRGISNPSMQPEALSRRDLHTNGDRGGNRNCQTGRDRSITSRQSRSRPRGAAINGQGANWKNGLRKPGIPPTTACPILLRARCSTVTSPTKPSSRTCFAIRASLPS